MIRQERQLALHERMTRAARQSQPPRCVDCKQRVPHYWWRLLVCDACLERRIAELKAREGSA